METTEPQYCKKCACEIPVEFKPQIDDVVNVAAEYFDIKKERITGKFRREEYFKVRHTIMHYLYYKKYKLTEIGTYFKKHHGTVINARDSMENRFFCDKQEKRDYDNFCKIINEKLNANAN